MSEGEGGTAAAGDGREEGELLLAVVLTAIAGFVDASAFLRFTGLFVSFMSGNSTRLGALPSQGRLVEAAQSAGAIVLFVMGAFAGRLLAQSAGRWRRPALRTLVALLLTLAAACAGWAAAAPAAALGLGAMALAMGLQNSTIHRAGGAHASATYVTGTLVNLGHALADAVSGEPSPWAAYLLMWLGLVGGAAVGALATERFGPLALLAPATLAALLAVVLGGLVRRGRPAGSSS